MTAPSAIALVYLAGPYTAPTLWGQQQNQWRAEVVARRVAAVGAYPVTPHLCTPPEFGDLQTPGWWYAATLELMRRCDAVLLLPGWSRSTGARAERAEAERRGLPVFLHVRDLERWLESRRPESVEAIAARLGIADLAPVTPADACRLLAEVNPGFSFWYNAETGEIEGRVQTAQTLSTVTVEDGKDVTR